MISRHRKKLDGSQSHRGYLRALISYCLQPTGNDPDDPEKTIEKCADYMTSFAILSDKANRKGIINEMASFAEAHGGDGKQPFEHWVLSLAPDERLPADKFFDVAEEFLQDLGYTREHQYLIAIHEDRKHQHAHIVTNRRGVLSEKLLKEGELIRQSDGRLRGGYSEKSARKSCVRLQKKYGLKALPGDQYKVTDETEKIKVVDPWTGRESFRERPKVVPTGKGSKLVPDLTDRRTFEARLRGEMSPRESLQKALTAISERMDYLSWEDFWQELEAREIHVKTKRHGDKDYFVYSQDDKHWIKPSEIHRGFSLEALEEKLGKCPSLQGNQPGQQPENQKLEAEMARRQAYEQKRRERNSPPVVPTREEPVIIVPQIKVDAPEGATPRQLARAVNKAVRAATREAAAHQWELEQNGGAVFEQGMTFPKELDEKYFLKELNRLRSKNASSKTKKSEKSKNSQPDFQESPQHKKEYRKREALDLAWEQFTKEQKTGKILPDDAELSDVDEIEFWKALRRYRKKEEKIRREREAEIVEQKRKEEEQKLSEIHKIEEEQRIRDQQEVVFYEYFFCVITRLPSDNFTITNFLTGATTTIREYNGNELLKIFSAARGNDKEAALKMAQTVFECEQTGRAFFDFPKRDFGKIHGKTFQKELDRLRKLNIKAETRESKYWRLRIKAAKLTATEAARLDPKLAYLDAYDDQSAIAAILVENKNGKNRAEKAYQTIMAAIEKRDAKIKLFTERRIKHDMESRLLWRDRFFVSPDRRELPDSVEPDAEFLPGDQPDVGDLGGMESFSGSADARESDEHGNAGNRESQSPPPALH